MTYFITFAHSNRKFKQILLSAMFLNPGSGSLVGRGFEHNEITDINMRVCNPTTSRCISVSSSKSTQSLFGDIYSLKKPTVIVIDTQTHQELENWSAQSGYWDLRLNRLVLQKYPNNLKQIIETVYDLDNLTQQQFVMK